MKKFSTNLFLFSILMALLLLPISSFKLLKVNKEDVLGSEDIKTQFLEQTVEIQRNKILELKAQIEELRSREVKETSEAEQISNSIEE